MPKNITGAFCGKLDACHFVFHCEDDQSRKTPKKNISFTPPALLIQSVSRPVHDTDRKQNGNALVDLLQEDSVISWSTKYHIIYSIKFSLEKINSLKS